MRKTCIIASLLTLALALGLLALPAGAEPVSAQSVTQTLLLDGEPAEMEGYRIGGKLYTPLRALASLLADTGSRFALDWDGESRTVYLRTGEKPEPENPVSGPGRAVPSEWTLLVDGIRVELDCYCVDGWNCCRLAELAECVGFTLDYSPSMACLVILTEPEAQEPKKVDLLIYMVGSDLEPYAAAGTKDMAEMAASGVDTDMVNVLVYTGGATGWQSDVPKDCNALFQLTAEGFVQRKTFPLQSMGEASSLSRFVNYSCRKFPAETVHLILWDHGSGPVLGCGIDRLYDGDTLTLAELDAALAATPFGGEAKLGILGFDACLMASAELACVAAPYAEYLVASQETEPSFGWDYAFLADCGRVSSRELAESAADRYAAYCADYSAKKPSFRGFSTLSVTDLSLAGELETCINALFHRAADDVDTTYSRLAAARFRTHSLGRASTGSDYDLADLGDLARQLEAVYPEEVRALESVLDRAVVHSVSNTADCCGLSLYYPCYNKLYYRSSWQTRYRELGLFSEYQAYLEKYGERWSDTELSAFFREPLLLREGEEPGTYVLDLTEEQAPLVAECCYYILEHDPRLERFPDAYNAVYACGDVTLSGSRLTAVFDGNVIYCQNRFGDRGLLSSRLMESREDTAVYRTTCTLKRGPYTEPVDSLNCWLLFAAEKSSGELYTLELYAQNGESLQSGKQQDLDLTDYTAVNFYHKTSRFLTRDENGLLLDYWSWPQSGVYQWYTLPVADGVSFCYAPLSDSKCSYYLILEFTDVQGNIHTSELFPLTVVSAEPEEEPVPEEESCWNGGREHMLLEREEFRLSLVAALEAGGGEPFLALRLENLGPHKVSLDADRLSLSGELLQSLSFWTEAGETEFFPLENLPGGEITDALRFRVSAGDWYTGGTLVRALDLTVTLAAEPEPGTVLLPVLGARAGEQRIFEENGVRAEIPGLGFFLTKDAYAQDPGYSYYDLLPLIRLVNGDTEPHELYIDSVEINGSPFSSLMFFPVVLEPGESVELSDILNLSLWDLEQAEIGSIETCAVRLELDGQERLCPVTMEYFPEN